MVPCSARLCQAVQVRRGTNGGGAWGEKGDERDPVGPSLLTTALRSGGLNF